MAFLVKISGTDVSFPAEKGERILDAAERAGYDIPHACRSGFCGSCSANVVSGDFITYAPGSKEGVPSHGPKILTCSTEAASDVEIAVQIKGKVRAKLEVPVDIDPADLEKQALAAVADRLGGKEPRKVIVKAPKIVSIVPAE